MLKNLITLFFFGILSLNAVAQGANKTDYPENPFKNLEFSRSPTDTLTLIVIYDGMFGKLSEANVSSLNCIKHVHNLNIKGFQYSIAFCMEGDTQRFYVPCKDKIFINRLSSKQSNSNMLKINCVVYRFFYIDGICNFFYIDKATILDNRI